MRDNMFLRMLMSIFENFYEKHMPRPETHEIEPLGGGFLDFWSQCQKITNSSFLVLVLSTSGAKARKTSNWVSWGQLCRLLEPRSDRSVLRPLFFIDLVEFLESGFAETTAFIKWLWNSKSLFPPPSSGAWEPTLFLKLWYIQKNAQWKTMVSAQLDSQILENVLANNGVC